jgi:hypothetical protein
MPWKDLRREIRQPLSERILLTWSEDGAVYHVRGQCLNISDNGLAVETFDVLPQHGTVNCAVLSLNLMATATVRHSQRRGLRRVAGLEFEELRSRQSPDC